MVKLLAADELDAALRSLPGWTRQGRAIAATFTFRDFAAAFAFMTRVAAVAEELQHHPDWRNSWSRVEISLSTHDAGGVTERDLALARRIAVLAAAAR
jgi:4a-hydroxytetrahydrobiopterin dehydratase